jgi:hypothetical protein
LCGPPIEQMNQDSAKSRCALLVAAALAALLVLPAANAGAVGRAFYGVVPGVDPTAAEFETMGAAQVGTYRFPLGWSQVQQSQGGPFDWSEIDPQVENAAVNGIELLPIAYGVPNFIGPHREPPLGSSEAKQGWQDFLAAAAERYGPGGEFWTAFELDHPGVAPQPIEWWQIWNEQNSPTFFEPKPSPKKYAQLLEVSDVALREVDSGAKILVGGMFGTPGRKQAIYAWKYLKRLYQVNGAKSHFDAVALHPYSPNISGLKAQIELARKKMKKVGGRRTPIWITELGWGSAGTKAHPLIKSESGQKRLLRKSFNLLLDKRGKWKIRRILWFAWRDPGDGEDVVGGVCNWCGSAGLFDGNLDPKPSFDQFKRFTGAP